MRSKGRGLPSLLDEQTLELFYATGQGCSRTRYQTELHLVLTLPTNDGWPTTGLSAPVKG